MPVGIHADHRGMTKFSNLQDPGLRSVAGQLKQWNQQIVQNQPLSSAFLAASPSTTPSGVGPRNSMSLQIATDRNRPPKWFAAGVAPSNETMNYQHYNMLVKTNSAAAMAYHARFAGHG